MSDDNDWLGWHDTSKEEELQIKLDILQAKLDILVKALEKLRKVNTWWNIDGVFYNNIGKDIAQEALNKLEE